jgi:uncharacterized repeat protein (TIGR01451 family)
MLSRSFVRLSLAAVLATVAVGLSACTSCYTKPKAQAPAPVVIAPAPVEAPVYVPPPVVVPASPGITISPEIAVNPVRTQHVLVATVTGPGGNPMAGEKVEWMLTGDGAIVDVDGGEKVDNGYAVSRTASSAYVLDRGNADPSDDVRIGAGQTWCVITSGSEGTSNIIAYAPNIPNWDKHKAFAVKNWMDVTWEWPVDATNRVGSPHTFTTRVMRYSDGTPLVGYHVNYEIIGGPSASFAGGGQSVSVMTDNAGVATATLSGSGQIGTNDVEITIVQPANAQCCIPERHIISGVVRKTWVKPEIMCTKSGPSVVTAGDTFDYTITCSNPSGIDARGTTVTDMLPGNVRYVSSSPMGQASGNSVTWNVGDLEAGGSRTMTVTVQATAAGRATNKATVSAENGALTHDCMAETMVEPKRTAQLAITCTCPPQVITCDPIVWNCTVTNSGDGAAEGVTVNCRLPDGLVCDGMTGASEHFIGTLMPGESRTITSNCTASRSGSFTKTCTVSSTNANTAEASCTTNVKQPALTITKSSSRQVWKLGRPITWTITVTSSGDVAAKDVILSDMVPAGTTFASASNGGNLSGNTVTWNLGTLNTGESRTVEMVTTANSQGTVRNTATARAYCAPDVSANAQVTVEGIPAILLECIDVDDPIEVGGTETYVIDVTNQGTSPDNNVVIVVTLPAEQEFVSAQGAGGVSHSVSGRTITFAPFGPLQPKARATYRVIVKAIAEGDVRLGVKRTADSTTGGAVTETESTHQY